MTISTLTYTTLTSETTTTVQTPTSNLIKLDVSDSSNETIVFGTLGLIVAIAGVVLAVLQLRRRRRARAVHVHELD